MGCGSRICGYISELVHTTELQLCVITSKPGMYVEKPLPLKLRITYREGMAFCGVGNTVQKRVRDVTGSFEKCEIQPQDLKNQGVKRFSSQFHRSNFFASPTLPGDEDISGWLSPPCLILRDRDQAGSTCSRAR